VGVLTNTGGSGLAFATGKFMSQFVATDQLGLARAVYNFTYKYQLLGAVVATVGGVSGVWFFGDKHFRVMACILVLSIVPGAMSWVPAQANLAFEQLSKNAQSAFGYIFAYSAVILLTLYFHWDLVGIASASLVGRIVEVVLRTIPLHAKLRGLPLEPLPIEIAKLVRRFCFQAMGIQFLMAVVWNRSELIFLRRADGFLFDERGSGEQVTFGSAHLRIGYRGNIDGGIQPRPEARRQYCKERFALPAAGRHSCTSWRGGDCQRGDPIRLRGQVPWGDPGNGDCFDSVAAAGVPADSGHPD
jgi:hypothetical protein